jgi:hypothetical protein
MPTSNPARQVDRHFTVCKHYPAAGLYWVQYTWFSDGALVFPSPS